MMKKLVSVLLAGAMVFSLAACGGSSSSSSSQAPAAEAPAAEAPADGGAAASTDTDWPTGTVSVTVPYNAGGDTDTYCRALFDRVGKKFGQTFVVTNLTGGSGMVAAMDVMSKKPDGYTILFNHTGASLVQEATDSVDFSYTEDFDNCCTVALDQTYTLVGISPTGKYKQYSRGWTDLAGMIEDAKANPAQIRYSTVFGSTTQYVGQMLEKLAGVQFDNIDVGTSSGDRLAAMLGGQVDIAAFNYTNIADYVEAGDLVVLGVMAEDHVDGIDFPTFKELGYDISWNLYNFILGPASMDDELAKLIWNYYAEAAKSDAVNEILVPAGMDMEMLPYEEGLSALKAMEETLDPVIEALGLKQ